ncbi:hypothetical protein E3N88_15764 [Mikania micrantha]|uniref:Uncharacterized protein n=1 Tax=Mikania micrantha TaxID=192012 RepID=A0A5N6NWI2_9ASTR|nr:hypothetical protein E3N88_15764 [Mikania micrantha]
MMYNLRDRLSPATGETLYRDPVRAIWITVRGHQGVSCDYVLDIKVNGSKAIQIRINDSSICTRLKGKTRASSIVLNSATDVVSRFFAKGIRLEVWNWEYVGCESSVYDVLSLRHQAYVKNNSEGSIDRSNVAVRVVSETNTSMIGIVSNSRIS